ncbi:MAG: aquaporin [Xanthomonadales bacterium]|nr:aquaporin [Xanthomonadales bacterium]
MSAASKAAAAEFAGTLILLAIVIGSGIMGEALAQGNVAIALLANALATGAGLYVLITALGPVSGAHFNPLVTLMQRLRGEALGAHWSIYLFAQFAGALLGVWLAHAMFDLPILQAASKARATPGLWISEIVATTGLLATIVLGARASLDSIAARVGCYIFAAYWFTASTSFANPAVTFARMFSDSFAGILPAHAPAFIAAQCVGLGIVLGALRFAQSASNGAR